MSAITERMDMGLYEVPLSVSLLGFGMMNVSPRGPVSCHFTLFYCLLDLSGGKCDVTSLYCLVKQFAICWVHV